MDGTVTLTIGDKSREIQLFLFNNGILFAKPVASVIAKYVVCVRERERESSHISCITCELDRDCNCVMWCADSSPLATAMWNRGRIVAS
jgi:hypothetical protein